MLRQISTRRMHPGGRHSTCSAVSVGRSGAWHTSTVNASIACVTLVSQRTTSLASSAARQRSTTRRRWCGARAPMALAATMRCILLAALHGCHPATVGGAASSRGTVGSAARCGSPSASSRRTAPHSGRDMSTVCSARMVGRGRNRLRACRGRTGGPRAKASARGGADWGRGDHTGGLNGGRTTPRGPPLSGTPRT